jgi:hypothetical protein
LAATNIFPASVGEVRFVIDEVQMPAAGRQGRSTRHQAGQTQYLSMKRSKLTGCFATGLRR